MAAAAACGAITVAGAQQPAGSAELFAVDNAHSLFDFTVRHIGFSRVRGSFEDYSSHVLIDPLDTTRSVVAIAIRVRSVATGNSSRDERILKPDFLDAVQHPLITFVSERIERDDVGYVAVGPLVIRGTPRQMRVPVTISSELAADQWGNRRFVASGVVSLNRRDFGVGGTAFFGRLIGDTVHIEFELAGQQLNYEAVDWSSDGESAGKLLLDRIERNGLGPALEHMRQLKRSDTGAVNFAAGELVKAAGRLANGHRFTEAAAVLGLAVEVTAPLPPETQALIEARQGFYLLRSGDAVTARQTAQAALSRNPANTGALALAAYLGAR